MITRYLLRIRVSIYSFAWLPCLIFFVGGNSVYATDLEAGKALAKSKGCFECHGLSGNKEYETDPPVPKLAGQPKAYLVKAMKDYRSGARKDETMNVLMGPRSDSDIELLATYFSSQKRY